MTLRRILLFAGLALAMTARAGWAADAPSGPVVITVAGAIQNANRGPVDPFDDTFFAYHEIAFERAFGFDRAALEALGMHRITTKYPGSETVIEAEGPLLRDILAAAGATGDVAVVTALDGYAAEVAIADAAEAVLALRVDGRELGLGGRGPAWLVFPDDPALAERGDAQWVWAAFFVRVE